MHPVVMVHGPVVNAQYIRPAAVTVVPTFGILVSDAVCGLPALDEWV